MSEPVAGHQRKLTQQDIKETLRALAFLIAARSAIETYYETGKEVPGLARDVETNTFYAHSPGHGVTDALNVLIEFCETFP